MSAAPSAAPSGVLLAHRLYLVSAVLGLLSVVVSLVSLPQAVPLARQQLEQQLTDQERAGLDLDAIATATAVGTIAVAAVIGIAFAVLTVVFARRLLAGRNWARIVLLVFAVLDVIGLVGLVAPGTSVLAAAPSVLGALAAAAAAVLTFLPASQPWFRRTLLPPTAY